MNFDVFGRVMSRYVYKCRAKYTYVAPNSFFFAVVVGVLLRLLARFGGRFSVRAALLRT